MNSLQESTIPSFVWDFVKKNTSNIITAGILALIIWNFVNKRQKESYTDSELQDIMYEALYYNKTDKDGAHYTDKVSKEEEWNILVKNSKVSGTKTLHDGEYKLSDSELDYVRNKLKSKGLIESLDLTGVKLSKSWGDCKRNSDLIKSKIGGQVKSVFSPTVDGINGHYYWTDGTYVVDYVIHNQKDIYSKLRSKEIDTGVWKLVDYRNILDLKESYLERLEVLR